MVGLTSMARSVSVLMDGDLKKRRIFPNTNRKMLVFGVRRRKYQRFPNVII